MGAPKGILQTFENQKEYNALSDGLITGNFKVLSQDFQSESHLKQFVTDNIRKFVEEYLSDELIRHEVEKQIVGAKRFGPRQKSVDLFIVGKKREYLVELKNPKYHSENRAAIGQLLNYGRHFPGAELILITTKLDTDTVDTIDHYKLPIRFLYVSKKTILENYVVH